MSGRDKRGYWVARLGNAVRKVASGLGLRGECVWPGVKNDLFVAHASIYHFFARHAEGKRVLDAGCGTGYGSLILARSGASEVLGLDIDSRNIRYARRHAEHRATSFDIGDCEALRLAPESFELIVSSNVLEHLVHPERFLDEAAQALAPRGTLILVMPAITNEFLLAANEAVKFHVSNLYVDDWIELFGKSGWRPSLYRHVCRKDGEGLDFSSPFESDLAVEDFEFLPASRDELYTLPTLGGVYVLTRKDDTEAESGNGARRVGSDLTRRAP